MGFSWVSATLSLGMEFGPFGVSVGVCSGKLYFSTELTSFSDVSTESGSFPPSLTTVTFLPFVYLCLLFPLIRLPSGLFFSDLLFNLS